jgi:peptidoglycan/LPS O-acetylase OafA/YrhL
MSRHHALLRSAGRRFDAARTSIKVAFGVIATVLLTARWPLIASGHPGGVGEVASVVGSCLVVWCFATTSVGHAAGTQRAVAWIGHRSFSLYLVHEPFIVTTAVLLGRRANPVVVLAISLPVSLVVAAAFYRIVEHPSHRVAKWIVQVMAPPWSAPTTVTPHDPSESRL